MVKTLPAQSVSQEIGVPVVSASQYGSHLYGNVETSFLTFAQVPDAPKEDLDVGGVAVPMATIELLAIMKAGALINRGTKRDFVAGRAHGARTFHAERAGEYPVRRIRGALRFRGGPRPSQHATGPASARSVGGTRRRPPPPSRSRQACRQRGLARPIEVENRSSFAFHPSDGCTARRPPPPLGRHRGRARDTKSPRNRAYVVRADGRAHGRGRAARASSESARSQRRT